MTENATELDEVVEPDVNGMLSHGAAFAPGQPAEHQYGVIYQGPWETLEDGTCRAVRLHANALAKTGIPVLLKSFSHTRVVGGMPRHVFDSGQDPNVLDEVGTLHHTSIASAVLVIKHMVVRSIEQVIAALYPRGVVGADQHETERWRAMVAAGTVLYTVWERDRIPKDIAKLMSRAGQCWVPCRQNREALIASGVPEQKVHVVPHPYTDAGYKLSHGEGECTYGGTGRPQSFYSIGTWQPRKGMHELLGAFLMAFRADEAATLRLRTTEGRWDNYPSPRESLRQWLADPFVKGNGWTVNTLKGKVDIFTHHFTPEALHEFHLNNRIYVCASHGEAWCLPAFDAKLYRNLVVHVPWGGTADFCDENDVSIPLEMEQVAPQYGWGDCKWAGYKIQDLVMALRGAVYRDGNGFRKDFSSAAVGQLMKGHLRELSRTINTPEAQRALFGDTP